MIIGYLSIRYYQLLCLIWEHEPIKSMQLKSICTNEMGWNKSTFYTMLRELGKKGFIINDQSMVRSLVSREAVQSQMVHSFVDDVFSGSLQSFLQAYDAAVSVSNEVPETRIAE